MKNIKANKKKIIIITSIVLITVISIVSFKLIFSKPEKDKDKTPNLEKPTVILGEERLEGTNYISNLMESYTKSVPNLLEYAKNNKIDSMSLKNLSETFKIDIKEFENAEYNCKKDTTMITFKSDYSDYFFSIDCSLFYLK